MDKKSGRFNYVTINTEMHEKTIITRELVNGHWIIKQTVNNTITSSFIVNGGENPNHAFLKAIQRAQLNPSLFLPSENNKNNQTT